MNKLKLLDKNNSKFCNEPCGTSHYLSVINNNSFNMRNLDKYDSNISKSPQPHTDFVFHKTIKMYRKNFKIFTCESGNIDRDFPFNFATKKKLLNIIFSKLVGLDLYITVRKLKY
jgi:hypothetical protein